MWRFIRLIGVGFLLAIALNVTYLLPVHSLSPRFANHWSRHCVQALAQRSILSVPAVALPASALTQQEFAKAVLRVFPGTFAAANEALGLEFEAPTEAEALLLAALGDQAQPTQRILRSQALSVLTTGAAIPYQADANRILQSHFHDSSLIRGYAREGVAAALAQGYVVFSDRPERFNPNRSLTLADAAGFLCRASGDAQLAATIPDERVVPFQAPSAIAAPGREIRGVWLTNIDSDVLFSRSRLETSLITLAELNFNTVYPTVWNWGYTLFPSRVAERTVGHAQGLYPDLDNTGQRRAALEATQANRDMLQEIIDIAHPLGLKVIPWFEFGFMVPADGELARRHPDWLTQKQDGSTVTFEGSHPRAWLNPFHPEVQQFILSLIDELVSQYPIDGFQVDDHFGLPSAYGYDPYTVSRYQRDHDGQLPPADATDPDWLRWRADQITDFMGQVFRRVKSYRPQAVLSVSPNPHEFAYEYYLQDWDTWVGKGYVEELIIQLYRSDLGRFVWEMNQEAAISAQQHIPTAIGVLSGLRGRPVPMARIQEQVEAIRDR
ncbi:MAG: family 10 glycosylhydrolase, partial [Leptolyngbya sp. SIO4C1]|nr:family 10 glycosylhydrolase [Leptolyngbya sp. SIO4C1]